MPPHVRMCRTRLTTGGQRRIKWNIRRNRKSWGDELLFFRGRDGAWCLICKGLSGYWQMVLPSTYVVLQSRERVDASGKKKCCFDVICHTGVPYNGLSSSYTRKKQWVWYWWGKSYLNVYGRRRIRDLGKISFPKDQEPIAFIFRTSQVTTMLFVETVKNVIGWQLPHLNHHLISYEHYKFSTIMQVTCALTLYHCDLNIDP